MTTNKLVNLMLKCSNSSPHTGKLPIKQNIIAAIELAKLNKKFADDGQKDEAMNVGVQKWQEVIKELNTLKKNESRN